jgi:hypothetical protein
MQKKSFWHNKNFFREKTHKKNISQGLKITFFEVMQIFLIRNSKNIFLNFKNLFQTIL